MQINQEILILKNKLSKISLEYTGLVSEIINFIFEDKGKLLRPILFFYISKALQKQDKDLDKKFYDFAQAIEMTHIATLCHDDILDSADIRRGKSSCYKKWGSKIAILTGDFLLAKALNLLNKIENPKILKSYSLLIHDLCLGEFQQEQDIFNLENVSQEAYIQKSKLKTANMFSFSAESACLLSGVSTKVQTQMKAFGENIGIAFQIKDDLKDFNIAESSNKPIFNDLKCGIFTLPIIIALQKEYKNKLKEILIKKAYTKNDLENILEILNKSKAFEESEEIMKDYLNKAEKNLEILENNIYKQEILGFFNKSFTPPLGGWGAILNE